MAANGARPGGQTARVGRKSAASAAGVGTAGPPQRGRRCPRRAGVGGEGLAVPEVAVGAGFASAERSSVGGACGARASSSLRLGRCDGFWRIAASRGRAPGLPGRVDSRRWAGAMAFESAPALARSLRFRPRRASPRVPSPLHPMRADEKPASGEVTADFAEITQEEAFKLLEVRPPPPRSAPTPGHRPGGERPG